MDEERLNHLKTAYVELLMDKESCLRRKGNGNKSGVLAKEMDNGDIEILFYGRDYYREGKLYFEPLRGCYLLFGDYSESPFAVVKSGIDIDDLKIVVDYSKREPIFIYKGEEANLR